MVSVKPHLWNNHYGQKRLLWREDGSPKVVQLLGNEVSALVQAAQQLQDWGVDAIDLNLGCPAKCVHKQAAGAALLRDLPHVARLLSALVRSVSLPVSVKTRLGDTDKHTIFELVQIAADAGVAWLAVHGRTRQQRFTGAVDYETLGEAALRSALPLIANGNIETAQQALDLLHTYPFAGVMIGRAAQGQPQLFAQIRSALDGRAAQRLKRQDIERHLLDLHEFYGEHAVKIARQHLHAYARHQGREQREAINTAPDLAAQMQVVQQLCD